MSTTRFLVIAGIILAAAGWRLIPHLGNFAPVGALALFAGACLRPRWAALLVPLLAMALSDVVLYAVRGYPADPVVYLTFALIVCIGFWLQSRRRVVPIAGAAIVSAILFFLITNFAVWATGGGYARAKTLAGLIQCYQDAVPFFRNTLMGDALFTILLFGGFALAEYLVPELREKALVPVTETVPEPSTADREGPVAP